MGGERDFVRVAESYREVGRRYNLRPVGVEQIIKSIQGNFGFFWHFLLADEEFECNVYRGSRVLAGDDVAICYGMAYKVGAFAVGGAEENEF